MKTTTTTVIAARVESRHAEQLRQIAHRNASTVSRTAARIIEQQLDASKTGPLPTHDTDTVR